MAYNEQRLTKLGALKDLAEKVKADYATKAALEALSGQVDGLVTAGGEPNVITAVKVNGQAQAVADKAVDITVPTKVSDLSNDSKFQTETDVAAAVAAADHLTRRKVASKDDIDPAADGADKIIYMVPKTGGKNGDKFDEYMVIDGTVEPVGDWAVDLSGYQAKEEGKGLSANDYTDEEKAKLAGMEIATDAEVDEMLSEVFAPAQEQA